MTDLLIRGVPDDVVRAIDAHARRAGLSRAEYLRRVLGREAGAPSRPVDAGALARLDRLTADLGDRAVMDDAWS